MTSLLPQLILLIFSILFLCWLVWQNYLADREVKRLRKELADLEVLKFCILQGLEQST